MLKEPTGVAVFAAASASATAQSCTRDGLKATVANDFKAAANLRVSENGQEMKAGEGFFKSGGKVQLQRSLIDTERCGTVTEALTEETVDGVQTLAVMAVRLKVGQGRAGEIETIVAREAQQKRFYNPKTLLEAKDQDWSTPLPADKRLTRECMNEGADKYFDDFSNHPPAEPPFATPVLTHVHRRFPVTDLGLGITAGFINFNQSLPDVHIFKYKADGKIELINAVFGGRQQGPIRPDETK